MGYLLVVVDDRTEVNTIFIRNKVLPISDLQIKLGIHDLFSLFLSFLQTVAVNKCSIIGIVSDDWIQTRVIYYKKQQRCQLRHNHCPEFTPLKQIEPTNI